MPTVQDILAHGPDDPPITALTAYDTPTASILESAGIDIALVGDSVGNTLLGYETTLPVTVDQMASHTAAVARGVDEALVVTDLPFLSVGVSQAETVANAGRMVKECGADAVKIESGPHTVEVTKQLVQLGIPVMAHLGLTPQRVRQLGGYRRQGTTAKDAREILDLAHLHQRAGAFSVVLEHIPANVAKAVTDALSIPTIGIGAGPDTHGQVLVVTDVVGLSPETPPFAERFGGVREEMEQAVADYRDAVRSGAFPADEHSYVAEELDAHLE